MDGDPGTLLVKLGGSEKVVTLQGDHLSIGRDPGCTIHLPSPYISRQHARIDLTAEGPRLVDLGSQNGCLVNGRRVDGSVLLRVGDVITIVDAVIECREAPFGLKSTLKLVAASPEPDATDRLHLDAPTFDVRRGGRPLARRLSAQEFQLLRYLYEQQDRVCTREELGDGIWGKGNWEPNMLHRLVHRLKEKLEPDPEHPRYVHTVQPFGYRVTP